MTEQLDVVAAAEMVAIELGMTVDEAVAGHRPVGTHAWLFASSDPDAGAVIVTADGLVVFAAADADPATLLPGVDDAEAEPEPVATGPAPVSKPKKTKPKPKKSVPSLKATEPDGLIHMMTRSEKLGSTIVTQTKCGYVERRSPRDAPTWITAFHSRLTCPTCQFASAHSVEFAEQQETARAALAAAEAAMSATVTVDVPDAATSVELPLVDNADAPHA